MYKKLIIGLVLLLLPFQVFGQEHEDKNTENHQVIEDKALHALEFTSNQFTQPEVEQVKLPDKTSFEGFEKIAENDKLILYVNEKSLALKIQDKKTGYVWKSGLDHPENYKLNNMWEDFAQSAITINYVDQKGKEKQESLLSNGSRGKITKLNNGFSAKIFLNKAKLELKLNVTLEDDSIVVSIPESDLKENKRNKLVSLQVYPFLGAVNKNDISGYMFIPDGSGALIRYQAEGTKADTPFKAPIYGNDRAFERTIVGSDGFGTVPAQQIRMPVFGAVHGVNHNGFLAVVEKGFNYGEILAYPSGVTTDFNWVTSEYNYRYQYYQPTSKSMSGVNVYQQERNHFDIALRFMFLEQENADYVGMAKRYQQYLVDQEMLTKEKDNVDVRLEFLGGEKKEGLLWDSVVPMTELNRIPDFVQELEHDHVQNMFVIYRGWTKGGLTGSLPKKFPVENNIGSKKDVKETIEALKEKDIPMYFYTDYTKAYEDAKGYSGRTEVAKKISSETISNWFNGESYYYLSPEKSLEMAKDDVAKYKKYEIENLAVDTTANTLFSDFNEKMAATRPESMSTYQNLIDVLNKGVGGMALYTPNVYAWNNMNRYLDIPMYASGYLYETDTVPFLQIVLKGYKPYYAPYSNFYAEPKAEVLRMIEFGAYPSFYLTDEPSHLLMDTPSSDVFTSEFANWKSEIIDEYKQIQDSLGQVSGETIEDRVVLDVGVVKVSYSNGVAIVVNYTEKAYHANGVKVQAKNFTVIDGGNE